MHSKDSTILNTKRIHFYKVLQATSGAFFPNKILDQNLINANQRNQKSLTICMK